ncbi:MAG TPA: hypothetical protein VF621_19430, partial [Pyrinomonadaceae bacterium]
TEGAVDRAAVGPFREAVNAGQTALWNFRRGDAGRLAAAAELLAQSPAPTPAAAALREGLKALVARAGETAADKSLSEPKREKRLRQLDADLDEWQEQFALWSRTEGKEIGVSMQQPGEPAGEKR